jgi:hypothetical protein
MRKNAILLATIAMLALAFGVATRAQDAAKVDGNWELSMQGPNGSFTQTLTIQQDGAMLKGSAKGRRGDSPLEGKMDGNKIHFTITRQTPNGERKMEYNGTVDGDNMKGTVSMGENEREWTAKRSAAAPPSQH